MIKKFSKNEIGRDFCIGDIHGCFTKLKDKLTEIGFDETKDRLFSTGDLVDRGPESLDVVKWLTKPWFHSVRGNHEQMAIKTLSGEWPSDNYFVNGGAWFLGLVPEEQRAYVDLFESMPFIIEIETESGPVGIVHAEYPIGDWNDKEKYIDDKQFQVSLIWSRTRADFGETWRVKNIDWIYVGHTVMPHKTVWGNHVYLDTGAVFGGELTVIEI